MFQLPFSNLFFAHVIHMRSCVPYTLCRINREIGMNFTTPLGVPPCTNIFWRSFSICIKAQLKVHLRGGEYIDILGFHNSVAVYSIALVVTGNRPSVAQICDDKYRNHCGAEAGILRVK